MLVCACVCDFMDKKDIVIDTSGESHVGDVQYISNRAVTAEYNN